MCSLVCPSPLHSLLPSTQAALLISLQSEQNELNAKEYKQESMGMQRKKQWIPLGREEGKIKKAFQKEVKFPPGLKGPVGF